jgi:hypothetical protein
MMDTVEATLCGDAHHHRRKGFVMAAHRIRSSVARFVVATGLVASLFAGSFALVQPSHASASQMSYCRSLLHWANYYHDLERIYTNLYVSTGDDLYLVEADDANTLSDGYWHDYETNSC